MKKTLFKRNVTATAACVINECLISLIPTVAIIIPVFMRININEVFSTLFGIIYFLVIADVICLIISLIAGVFLKTTYRLEDDRITVKDQGGERSIYYYEVAHITYDFGTLERWNRSPSQLVLFDENFATLLSVNNPSILMTHIIKRLTIKSQALK